MHMQAVRKLCDTKNGNQIHGKNHIKNHLLEIFKIEFLKNEQNQENYAGGEKRTESRKYEIQKR